MNRAFYSVAVCLFWLLSRLPVLLARAIGSGIGCALWWFGSISRRVTEENLRACYPDRTAGQLRPLARASLQHLGMAIMEAGLVWFRSPEAVLARVTRVRGDEHMQQALAQGRGVIVLGPHIGNWEVLGLYLAEHFTVTSMFQPPDNPVLDAIIQRARMRSGAVLVPTNATGVKALLRALKRGEVVGVLPDQVPPASSGRFAPFFGIPALTMTLVYSLVQRTGARVVFAFAKRIAGGNFELVYMPAPEAIYAGEQADALAALNRGVELTVADAPAQYQWEYKRFRKQPDGVRRFYRKDNA